MLAAHTGTSAATPLRRAASRSRFDDAAAATRAAVDDHGTHHKPDHRVQSALDSTLCRSLVAHRRFVDAAPRSLIAPHHAHGLARPHAVVGAVVADVDCRASPTNHVAAPRLVDSAVSAATKTARSLAARCCRTHNQIKTTMSCDAKAGTRQHSTQNKELTRKEFEETDAQLSVQCHGAGASA